MKKKFLVFVLLLTFFNSSKFYSQNYNKIMGKAIKKAIGSDLKGYQIFSYPTDNFGLITSYENSVSNANFICDMWNCIGINNVTTDSGDWLKLNNFAGIGGGGTITLSEQKKTKVAVDVILPKIYDVVGVTLGAKKAQTKEINITIGKAFLRMLRKDPIISYINALDDNKSIKKAFNNGSLVIIVADCVIESITVSVKVDQEIGAKIDAKLGVTGTSVASKIFQDAQLSVNVEKTSSGAYTFKVLHPVIFARLAKKQPSGGSLGSDDNFNDWTTVQYNSDPSKK